MVRGDGDSKNKHMFKNKYYITLKNYKNKTKKIKKKVRSNCDSNIK